MLAVVSALALALSSPPPFWKAKPEVYKRIKDERAVVVSATCRTLEKQKSLRVISAGHISAPEDFTYKQILKFNEYSQILPYLIESSHDPRTQNIFFHGAFLGYHLRSTVHVAPETTLTGHLIKFRVISGHFTGMYGQILLEDLSLDATEISMEAQYEGAILHLPNFLLSWGVELAGKKAASVMREFIEKQWRLK